MNSNQHPVDEVHVKNLETQLLLARREINNLRQQVKTLNYVHRKECDEICRKLENWRCMDCRNRQDPNDNEAGASAVPSVNLSMKQIGVIRTSFPEKRGTPRQPGICPDTVAKLTINSDVFTNPHHTVEGLQEFSHMWILFLFHKNDSTHVRAKVAPPRLNGIRTGVFATRSPHRPSPIGLSLVKINRIAGDTVYFSGVDMVDETPVIDIKPYIPQYDNPSLLGLVTGDSRSDLPNTDSRAGASDRQQRNINFRRMDGEENVSGDDVQMFEREDTQNIRPDDVLGAASPESSRSTIEDSSFVRLNPHIGVREAPDGEEEEPPGGPQQPVTNPIPMPTTPEDHIRVPAWIDQPPVPTLMVTFKDRALAQLSQLGSEGDEKKRIISNVLREDPRSIYLRERWSSHCYVFRIAELYVSCKFDDVGHIVTVYQVFENAAEGEE